MKANELQIVSFLQTANVQFIIPVYQRNYDWTEKECKQLLDDIIAVENKNRESHFIGSIVFIHEGIYSTSKVKELVIIDGQQRLTTINILYVALFRFAKEIERLREAEILYNTFLINQYAWDEKNKLKLKQTDTSSRAFEAILNGAEKEFDTYSNVIENYNYFRSRLTIDNFDTILEGLNKLIFVEISLERGKDDPQRIFESLNSTGLDLSQSDLIRNYILMDLKPRRQKDVFERIWSPIENNILDSRMQTSLVSDFIRDYLTLRTKKIPNKSKVYEAFKQLHFDKNDEAFDQELEYIKSLSVHYKKFIHPLTVKDSKIRKELEYINRLEINVAYPFLLQIFEDADNGMISQDELVRILKLIQTYTWRRFISGYPTNALNKIFMTLYSEVDTEDYFDSIARALLRKRGSGKFPTDEEIKAALKDKDLYNIRAKNRSYLFELLENHNNNEWVDTSNELITVEHIFPQTPSASWKNRLSEEDYFLFSEKYLNTIANLTLSGNNGALGNKAFLEKKEMNLNGLEQGYIYSRLWFNQFLKSLDTWDIANLEKRYELIYKRFLEIWPYPDVTDDIVISTYEEQAIFDAESPRHKKLEYFIFEDTTVEEETIAQMYLYVLKQLYKSNPELLVSEQNVIKISHDSSEFRSPQEVANGWFIEINIDSDSKFSYLKRLLSLYDMEDELIIKYAYSNNIPREASRHSVRRAFWKQLLPQIRDTLLFTNVNPTKDHWLTTGAGISGIGYRFVVTRANVRIELAISTSSIETNKKYYNQLLDSKAEIENIFGEALIWEELPEYKMSCIKTELPGVNLYNEDDWERMNSFLLNRLPKFELAFRPYIERLKK